MRALTRGFIAAVLLGLAGVPALAQFHLDNSHIEQNVPASAEFDKFMRRDLLAYFQRTFPGTTTIDWVLLRREPTQSGVAYPKFYAWVKASGADSQSREGAIRLAAIDRVRFEVMSFMSAEDVLSNPESVGKTFPALLVPGIKAKAEDAKRTD